MNLSFSRDAVVRGYSWLDHRPGLTEVVVLHPDYIARDMAWNRSRRAWPLTEYVTSREELLGMVGSYAGDRMICYGINPRPSVLRRRNGMVRSATEDDIRISQTLVLDIDLEGTVTPERVADLERFLDVADEDYRSKQLAVPERAKTGRGCHLLFAYPPISVAEHPLLRGQLVTFKSRFLQEHRRSLDRLEARLDSTQDLRRMVRVYGTSKPSVGVISSFHGGVRVPDAALREYLLRLPAARRTSMTIADCVTVMEDLPSWFNEQLQHDHYLNELWQGRGKPSGDRSRSGHDYTIANYLASRASDEELLTILKLRPSGGNERARKGAAYLSRTITNARTSARPTDE